MADIFSILGQSLHQSAPRSPLSGSSTDDLHSYLSRTLESKVSPTKAEHVSFTYELNSSTRFTVPLSQTDNEPFGALDRGATPMHAQDGANEPSHVISANETIMNQPQDDPVLQKAVAKYITGVVSACDSSSWIVREVSRKPQGWIFTYVCKQSTQAWLRQNAKSVEKLVTGDYSVKELDPVSATRPAFDCQGSMVISFSRSSRNITVKYTHTAFHKTVAELAELFAPPPRPVAQPVQTPKSAKPRRKRDAPNDGEGGSSRKKARTKKSNAAGETQTLGEDITVEFSLVDVSTFGTPGETAGDGSQPKPKKKRAPRPKKKAAEQSGDPASANQPNGQEEASTTPTAATMAPLLNIDPEEAERRRLRAVELLEGSDIDPSTLSSDQFNIFANQSPGLQQESLAMLVRYGAERLRIIHPSKDTSTQSSETATASQSDGSTAPPVSNETSELQPAHEPASSNKKPKAQPLTRGSCSNCKGKKKTKCGRQKPACQNCVDAGVECVYPLQKSRPKKTRNDLVTEDTNPESEVSQIVDNDPAPEDPGDEPESPVDTTPQQDDFQPTHSLAVEQETQSTLDEPYPLTEQVVAPNLGKTETGNANKRRSLPSAPVSMKRGEDTMPLALPNSPVTSAWGTTTIDPSSLSNPPSNAAQSAPSTSSSNLSLSYQNTQQVAAATQAALQERWNSPVQAAQQGPARQSPYRATAPHPRAKSRASNRAQSRTPVPERTPSAQPQQLQQQTQHQPSVDSVEAGSGIDASYRGNSDSTRPTQAASKGPDVATYNAASSLSGLGNFGYNGYPSQDDNTQSSNRIAYEPYSNHPTSSTSNPPCPPYENYNRSTTSSISVPTTAAQSRTSSHSTSAHTTTTAVPSTSSYSYPSLPASTSSQNYFHLREKESTPTQSNEYAQKPQRQPQQQYPKYNPQPPNQSQRAEQPQAQTQQPQQNWYGFHSPASTSSARDSHSGYVSTGSYQHHSSLNMPSHGAPYGGADNDSLIDLLGGPVHHRH